MALAGEVEARITTLVAAINKLTQSFRKLGAEDAALMYSFTNACLNPTIVTRAVAVITQRSTINTSLLDYTSKAVTSLNSIRDIASTDSVVFRTPEYEERFSFCPMSTWGATVMANNPVVTRILVCVLSSAYLGILFLPIHTDFDCYWQYSAMILLGVCFIVVGAVGTDLNVFLMIIKKFDFLYPMVLNCVIEIIQRTVLYRRGYSVAAVVLSAVNSLTALTIWALILASDAAVYRPILLTRLMVMIAAVYCLAASVIENFTDYSKDPVMTEQYCFLYVTGCSTPPQVYTSFYRIIGLFLLKFLYTSVRYPHSLLMISRKINVVRDVSANES